MAKGGISPAVGGSFSPRLSPRPKYPPAALVARRAFWIYVRDMVLGVALTACLYPLYQAAFGALGLSERYFYAAVLSASHTGSYVIFNGSLYLLEQLGMLQQYKLTRKDAEIPTPALIKQLLTEAAVNQLLVAPVIAALLFSAAKHFGMPSVGSALPDVPTMLVMFAGAHAFNDVGFYFTHRLLHHPKLYARFHKQHHQFRGSVGAAAEFAGPVEVLLSNQIPTAGFLLLWGAHPLIQSVWIVLRLFQTYEVHSGYDFRHTTLGKLGVTANGMAYHDHHHTVNMGNFGSEHMDWLMGTMDYWVRDGEEDGYVSKRLGQGAAQEAPAKKVK